MSDPGFDVAECAIFLSLAGSRAHGTARPESDFDLRGVSCAPWRIRLSLFRSFEQLELKLASEHWRQPLWHAAEERIGAEPAVLATRTEAVLFEVAKFLRLCAEANPNALELLFADERDWLWVTPAWERLHRARSSFLTRKVQQTFLGYGLSQLRRIRTHRSWLLHPPAGKPTRREFGLPANGVFGADDRARLTELIAENEDAARELPPEVLRTLDAEKRYRGALKEWHAYETWLAERNPARAELERRHGYDTKHGAHLVRLMRMGLEVLVDGSLHVRRADAEELRAIRDGSLTYDALVALAEALEAQMKEAASRSRLASDVNRDEVDGLLEEVLELAS